MKKLPVRIEKRGFSAISFSAKTHELVVLGWFGKGEHEIDLAEFGNHDFVGTPRIQSLGETTEIALHIGKQARKRDRKLWYIFRLLDLPIKNFSADVTVQWRKFDGDDVKVVMDGMIKKNPRSLFHRNWVWSASPLRRVWREKKEFVENLPQGKHTMELWADESPFLYNVQFNISGFVRTPSVHDPLWTDNFRDDPDQILLARLIFGEARSKQLSDLARIAVGWSARNRVEDTRGRWGISYQDVILQKKQYSSFNLGDPNRDEIEDPRHNGDVEYSAWQNCYRIAEQIIRMEAKDPTGGANHFTDDRLETPPWATREKLTCEIDTFNFFLL